MRVTEMLRISHMQKKEKKRETIANLLTYPSEVSSTGGEFVLGVWFFFLDKTTTTKKTTFTTTEGGHEQTKQKTEKRKKKWEETTTSGGWRDEGIIRHSENVTAVSPDLSNISNRTFKRNIVLSICAVGTQIRSPEVAGHAFNRSLSLGRNGKQFFWDFHIYTRASIVCVGGVQKLWRVWLSLFHRVEQ